MAIASLKLVQALRQTADRLHKSETYQWGHMGSCNCGHLAQELTELTREEIHSIAMQSYGDWTEQAQSYCPTSGIPMDHLISDLLTSGLAIEDLRHLEKLSDHKVLKRIGRNNLRHNFKNDVVLYLNAWSDLLANELTGKIILPDFEANSNKKVNVKAEHIDVSV